MVKVPAFFPSKSKLLDTLVINAVPLLLIRDPTAFVFPYVPPVISA